MLLSKVDAERLPSAMLTPNINVKAEKPPGANAHMDRQLSRSVTQKIAHEPKAAEKEKSGPVGPLDKLERVQDYIPQESDGPTVHHDVIRLTGGVTLREGTSTRTGPKLTSYGDKLTREAYLHRSGKLEKPDESEEDLDDEDDEARDSLGPMGVGPRPSLR